MSISVRNKRYHKLIFFYNIFSEITHVHHYKTILPLRYKKSFRVSHARVLPQQTNNRNCSELNLDYYHHYLNMTIKIHYQVCVCVFNFFVHVNKDGMKTVELNVVLLCS